MNISEYGNRHRIQTDLYGKSGQYIKRQSLRNSIYETASAAGTVGLTLGLTPQLGVLSQSILILLMYFGRVGGLTLIYAAFSGHDLTYARYPQEKITVG